MSTFRYFRFVFGEWVESDPPDGNWNIRVLYVHGRNSYHASPRDGYCLLNINAD